MNFLSQTFLLKPGRTAFLLLTVMFMLMVLAGLHKPLTYDEPHNLYYGYQILTEGPSVVPNGQRMPVLALNALGCVSSGCDFKILEKSEWARFAVKWPSMLFALLAGLVIYRWGSRLFSPAKALLPLALFCLNPNYIAHGKQLTTDMHEVFFVLATGYYFWSFYKDRTFRNLFLFAFMTGMAILSKYSGIILLPAFGILFLVHFREFYLNREKILKTFAALFFTGFVVWSVINMGYLFSGTFTKASDYSWQSQRYSKLKNLDIPIPAPKVFTLGLDYTRYLEENPNVGRGNNYIFEKRRRKGRWYAFPAMAGLKTPLAFFVLLALGIFAGSKPKEKSFLWVPSAVWLAVFSLACDAQLGIRYILPGLTFLFLFTGFIFEKEISARLKRITAGLAVWYAVSALSYHPHYMSYFNELIGPRINAYKFLADSNLDWEDKTYFLKKFRGEHPELNVNIMPTPQTTGYFILSANEFTGVLDEQRYAFLRENYKPLRHITYSHYLFKVPQKAQT